MKGERIKARGDVGVGELGPTPGTCHDDAARHHREEVLDPRATFHEGGWNFLKSGRPTPCRSDPLLCQRRGLQGPSRAPH